jgi:hypothetical protein
VTKNEEAAVRELAAEGYVVLRSGWPDLLGVRVGKDGIEGLAVEVKAGGDVVRPNQARMIVALGLLGVKVQVFRRGRTTNDQIEGGMRFRDGGTGTAALRGLLSDLGMPSEPPTD